MAPTCPIIDAEVDGDQCHGLSKHCCQQYSSVCNINTVSAMCIQDFASSCCYESTETPTKSPSLSPTTSDPTESPTADPTEQPTTAPTCPMIDFEPAGDECYGLSKQCCLQYSSECNTNTVSAMCIDNFASSCCYEITESPTTSPSFSPTTSEPTESPSPDPTITIDYPAPAATSVTDNPTRKTKDPTMEPTTEPTMEPTWNPTSGPMQQANGATKESKINTWVMPAVVLGGYGYMA